MIATQCVPCERVDMSPLRHLKRLDHVWDKNPVYFVTTCVAGRKPLLADGAVVTILSEEWAGMKHRHAWMVGRYVVMPDHVHFFVSPIFGSAKPLATAIGKWKEWTAKRVAKHLGITGPLWQPEFFDHLLRSAESRSEKWDYVRHNPVRAELVNDAQDWPHAGAIDFE